MPTYRVIYDATCFIEAETLEEAKEMFLNHEGCDQIGDEDWKEIEQ